MVRLAANYPKAAIPLNHGVEICLHADDKHKRDISQGACL